MKDELLIAYYKGEVSDKEAQLITEWIDADKEHLKYYQRLCRLFEMSFWADDLGDMEVAPTSKKPRFLTLPWKRYALTMAQMAAVFIIGFAVHFFWSNIQTEQPVMQHEVHVPTGQHVQLLLADGSKVWLNSQSTLTFPAEFKEGVRRVKLEGEGFFEVKADAKRPFIVSTSEYEVKALGTAFNVYNYQNSPNFETALLQGKVEVKRTSQSNQVVTLLPNNRAILADGQLQVHPIENTNQYEWRQGILYFNAPLMEVFDKLKEYYDVQFNIKNKQLLKKSPYCTGKFRIKDGLEHIIRVLKETHHFSYQMDYESKTIIIS